MVNSAVYVKQIGTDVEKTLQHSVTVICAVTAFTPCHRGKKQFGINTCRTDVLADQGQGKQGKEGQGRVGQETAAHSHHPLAQYGQGFFCSPAQLS